MCEQWVVDKSLFFNWAFANGWTPILSIIRKDNDKPFTPDNCKIVSREFSFVERMRRVKKYNLDFTYRVNPNKKLNEEQVIKIINMIHNNIPHKQIAEIFNISVSTISSIKHKKTWSWVTN